MLMVCGAQAEPFPAVFSCHVTLFWELLPYRTSASPSPSTSAANTARLPRAPGAVEMVRVAQADPSPRVFSYQASLLSRGAATRTSPSPSPSTSAPNTCWAPAALAIVCRTQADPFPAVFSYHAMLSS